jgi:hypothetical protein
MEKIRFVLMIVVSSFIYGCLWQSNNKTGSIEQTISREKAIDIAKSKVPVSQLKDVNISCCDGTEYWKQIDKQHMPAIREMIYNLHEQRRSYWVVTFYPRKEVYGGVTIVFIDKKNGEVIDIFALQ